MDTKVIEFGNTKDVLITTPKMGGFIEDAVRPSKKQLVVPIKGTFVMSERSTFKTATAKLVNEKGAEAYGRFACSYRDESGKTKTTVACDAIRINASKERGKTVMRAYALIYGYPLGVYLGSFDAEQIIAGDVTENDLANGKEE